MDPARSLPPSGREWRPRQVLGRQLRPQSRGSLPNRGAGHQVKLCVPWACVTSAPVPTRAAMPLLAAPASAPHCSVQSAVPQGYTLSAAPALDKGTACRGPGWATVCAQGGGRKTRAQRLSNERPNTTKSKSVQRPFGCYQAQRQMA